MHESCESRGQNDKFHQQTDEIYSRGKCYGEVVGMWSEIKKKPDSNSCHSQ